jgi:hypothetical protein
MTSFRFWKNSFFVFLNFTSCLYLLLEIILDFSWIPYHKQF